MSEVPEGRQDARGAGAGSHVRLIDFGTGAAESRGQREARREGGANIALVQTWYTMWATWREPYGIFAPFTPRLTPPNTSVSDPEVH